MPLSDRDYMRGDHPIYCTCVDCVQERLKNISKKNRKLSILETSGLLSSKYTWMIGAIVIVAILMLIFL